MTNQEQLGTCRACGLRVLTGALYMIRGELKCPICADQEIKEWNRINLEAERRFS
jgi:hypothetical protein